MLKPIVPGCLAMIIKGEFSGRSVRCVSAHKPGEVVEMPDGKKYKYTPGNDNGDVPGWLVIGDVKGKVTFEGVASEKSGFGMVAETSLIRIDAEGDDDLVDEFRQEAFSEVMAEQMAKEGVKRLW